MCLSCQGTTFRPMRHMVATAPCETAEGMWLSHGRPAKQLKSTHRLTGEAPGWGNPRVTPNSLPKEAGRGENHYLRNTRTSRLPGRRERNHRKARRPPKPRKIPE